MFFVYEKRRHSISWCKINSPSNEFIDNLERNGFTKDTEYTYKGNYLGEETSIILTDTKDNHYKSMVLMTMLFEETSANKYFDNLCKDVESNHNGFKKVKEENGQSPKMTTYKYENSIKDEIIIGFGEIPVFGKSSYTITAHFILNH